jgi:hypothetical protein
VLVELSVMEQRYQAVLAVIQDGWKVVEVADRGGPGKRSPLQLAQSSGSEPRPN